MPKYRLTGTRDGNEFSAPVHAETEDDVVETFMESLTEDAQDDDWGALTVEPWQ